ncbi:MAG: DUF423 domain-containing protein [Alphaproteobacteria bacterium]|nr:DUF423 domain-containing protein [Alphaproteobacteria bacterium]
MWWTVAGLAGALGVALGAFGAHGLKGVVTDPHLLEVWDTGARYHLIHALALLAVAAHPARPAWAGGLFLAGIVLFSGSLYLMTLTGFRWLGAVTPLGGLCFIAGWLVLAFARSGGGG